MTRGLSIYLKLLGLIVGLVAVVVGGLATYFTTQQIDTIRHELRSKAETYAVLSATQTRSAVAFEDRETAREVLDSLSRDSDVASATLFGATGTALYTTPAASGWIQEAIGIDAPRVVERDGRILAAAPVASVEGPRGTLIIELSRTKLDKARARILWLAGAAGAGALVLGGLLAWLIARRLATRLRSIAAIATAVAGGDLERSPVRDDSRDEIGQLARAFNAMLDQLRDLIARIQQMARAEQDRLEALVAERTKQLDRRNAEMSLVFEHVEQGLVMVELDGTLAAERSRALERWLGPPPVENTLTAWIRSKSPAADWFDLAWSALAEDMMPLEVSLAQIPSRLSVDGRELELTYTPIRDGEQLRILVVVTDVTQREHQARAERDERETASLVMRLMRDRAGFSAFLKEAAELVATTSAFDLGQEAEYKRAVHTLKGVCALEDLASISELCQSLEVALAEHDELGARAVANDVTARWSFFTSRIAPLLESTRGKLEVPQPALMTLKQAIASGAPHAQLAAIVEPWTHESVARRLERFADQARALADRTGKGAVDVRVECGEDVVVPPEDWAPFWTAFSHVIRNAVDHGIEAATGKDDLVLRAANADRGLVIEVVDRGRGVDWERVRASAKRHGIPHTTQADLEAALFHDGLTTRDQVTSTSGRGVGMAAVRSACEASGGAIAVRSAGGGTTVRFTWFGPEHFEEQRAAS